MPTKPFEMRCSFCGLPHTDVAKLIAGPGIYICDGCVNLCVDILAETTHAEPPPLPEWRHYRITDCCNGFRSSQRRRPISTQDSAIAFTNCATAACHGQEPARHWA